jgi:hypothetical protein
VGFLRKDGMEIHRTADGVVDEDEQVLRPPQEEMEEVEEDSWRARLHVVRICIQHPIIGKSQGRLEE